MRTSHKLILFGTAAVVAGALVSPALAQGAGRSESPASLADTAPQLGEVVVTATRQSSTVNKVAMSVSAVGQTEIDRKGLASVQDLARTVPALTFTKGLNGENAINIRGITSVAGGAPTTAVFLDDAPLQKRTITTSGNLNGTPFPTLFDVERIEVLRGPQGTLFGGSSMGGAVRFVTPEPSLTKYSGMAKIEGTVTEGGGPSGRVGLAVGGPIVEGKLGFRASLLGDHTGGYIDHVNMYTSQTMAKDTNWTDRDSFRGAVLWSPLDRLKVTGSLYLSQEVVGDSDFYWLNVPQYKVNGGTFTNTGAVNGVKFAFPSKAFPGFTDGPYNMFGPFKSGTNDYTDTVGGGNAGFAERKRQILLPALVVEYATDKVTFRSSTNFISTHETGSLDAKVGYTQIARNGAIFPQTANNASLVDASGKPTSTGGCGQGVTAIPDYNAGCSPLRLPGFPLAYSLWDSKDKRGGFTQELRASSPADARLSWVAGLYYSDIKDYQVLRNTQNSNAQSLFLRGVPQQFFTNALQLPGNIEYYRDNSDKERELAVFANATYSITSRLKVNVGLRYSETESNLLQILAGPGAGGPVGFTGSPTASTVTDINATSPFPTNYAACPTTTGSLGCPFQYIGAVLKEHPFTPKYGISYQATEGTLLYFSASKGFRAGGLDPAPVTPQLCPDDFALLGITGTLTSFKGDSLWSYETGAKMRLFGGKAQLNGSVFLIDWKDPLTSFTFAKCGKPVFLNAGHAQSKGFDLEGQVRPMSGLTVSFSVSRNDARYVQTVQSPGTTPTTMVQKGDFLPSVPDWSFTVGAEYRFEWLAPEYVRFDYQYSGQYVNGPGPGDLGYDPVTFKGPASRFASAKVGAIVKGVDVNLFVNNLFDSRDVLGIQHLAGVALVQNSTFRPREVGLQALYHF